MILISKLIPLFIIIPLVELAILIQVGKWIGFWNTIGLVVLTGFLGAFLVQLEGVKIWSRLQYELMQFRMPTDQMIDGVLVLVGGIVLLTPGLITDLIGLTLLLPFTRIFYRKWLKNKFEKKFKRVDQAYHQSHRKKADVVEVEMMEDPSTSSGQDKKNKT